MNAQATEYDRTGADATTRGPGGIHVEESGTPGSPAIVFIHGAGQSGREWREHMRRLSDFHCLAPDLPGFGRSNELGWARKERVADLLARLIEERVPSKRASVFGISSGGLHVHALLDRHPDRVERAIIDGSPPFDGPRLGRAIVRLILAALSLPIHTRPGAAFWRGTHDPEDLRVASTLAMARTVAECFGEFAALDAPSPALLVAGEKESRVRPINAALAELMPHAEAWYAPGLDHCWQKADPDLHIRMVEAWVGGRQLPSELCREAAPSPAKVERVRRMGPEFWYVRRKGRIMRQMRFYLRPYRRHLAEAYGKEEGKAIAKETVDRFEALLPDLPYIGGGNRLTLALIMTAAQLALYRSLRVRGETVEGAARVMYQGGVRVIDTLPMRLLLRWQGRRIFDRKVVEQRRREALASQERRYADDWVFELVDGDGRDFEYGLDYSECGVVKYLKREGAAEIAPYLCWLDYPSYAAQGVKLIRTETLAQGGQRCDFRFGRGEPVHVEPEFLHA